MVGPRLEQPSATPTPCPLCRGAGQSAPQTTVAITRLTYFFGAQAAAQRITGDPDGDNNGLFYLLSDHLGSPVELADSAGTRRAEAARRYLPFGGYRQSAPTPRIERGFTGHQHNDDLGLIYMNARYYASASGRFITPDTLVPDPANPQALNRYSYVHNNPLRYTDPSGHCIVAPPFDTLVCIAVFALSLRADNAQPPQFLLDHPGQFKTVAKKREIDATVLAAVVTHESQALERTLAGVPERAQLALVSPEQLPFTSIGPAQIQLRTAEMLENLGYIAQQSSTDARIHALLDPNTAIDYAGAYLQYLGERHGSICPVSASAPAVDKWPGVWYHDAILKQR